MYIFYSEIFHYLNLFHNAGSLVKFVLCVAVAVYLRSLFEKRKKFYKMLITVTGIWVVCQVIQVCVSFFDSSALLGFFLISFELSWILFTFLAVTGLTHLVCRLLHKWELQ